MLRKIRSHRALLAMALLLCGAEASANYVRNAYLLEELETDPERVLPSGEHYSLAVDAEFFKPNALSESIQGVNYAFNQWHGNGYWIDTRVELRPVEQIRLNWKLTAYQGSSSGGPASYGSRILSRAALSVEDELPGTDWIYRARASELGRRTLGRGLIIEDRETVGISGELETEGWNLTATVDGTGGVWVEGEVFSLEAAWRDGLIGLTVSQFTEDKDLGQQLNPLGTVVSLYSTHPIAFHDRLVYDLEVAHANRSMAGLMALSYAVEKQEQYSLLVRPQLRRYFGSFGAGVAQRTEPVFFAYDQLDDRFTNFQNIFVYGSNSLVYSLNLQASYRVVWWLRLTTDHELGRFQYRGVRDVDFHFFKSGFQIIPIRDRDDHLFTYISNKWLNGVVYDTNGTPIGITPQMLDTYTRPKFVNGLHFGFIGRVRF